MSPFLEWRFEMVGIVIGGPTGVGKTELSIKLAKILDAVIINCDSMQIYKEMNIGTAKIKEEEKETETEPKQKKDSSVKEAKD